MRIRSFGRAQLPNRTGRNFEELTVIFPVRNKMVYPFFPAPADQFHDRMRTRVITNVTIMDKPCQLFAGQLNICLTGLICSPSPYQNQQCKEKPLPSVQ